MIFMSKRGGSGGSGGVEVEITDVTANITLSTSQTIPAVEGKENFFCYCEPESGGYKWLDNDNATTAFGCVNGVAFAGAGGQVRNSPYITRNGTTISGFLGKCETSGCKWTCVAW